MLAAPLLALAFAAEASAFLAPHPAALALGGGRAGLSVSYAKRPALPRAAAVRLAPQMALAPKEGKKTWVDR